MRWIRFTLRSSGGKCIINSDWIMKINPEDIGSWIVLHDKSVIHVSESFYSICKMLKPFVPDYADEPAKVPIDTPVADLDFTVRAENIMRREGIITLEGLLSKFRHYEDAKAIKGLGHTTLMDIVGVVQHCGYRFAWDKSI